MSKYVWMRKLALAGFGLLVAPAIGLAAIVSTPVDISDLFNVDGFAITQEDTFVAGAFGLDNGGQRVQAWTLPANFQHDQPNATADGVNTFLFGPTNTPGVLDSYRPSGETIDVPNGQYNIVYLAAMSGNGEFPGNTWAGKDIMTFNYTDGTSVEQPIGVVNDWFWLPPSWVAPESGNASEIVVDLTAHDSDIAEFDHLIDLFDLANPGNQSHDYGKYRFANGEEQFLVYELPYEAGATLYLKMWGNIKVDISTDYDFDGLDQEMDELYNSVEDKGQAFPGGGDGYVPPQQQDDIYEFDLSSILPAGTDTFYLRFSDAAPGEATDVESGNWGARINRIGLFTGPVVESRLGDRIWPGLVRTPGNNAPEGGLQLIRKGYRLDNTKTLESITMPDLMPNASPFLTIFGITLGVDDGGTAVQEFMLH